MLFDDVSPRRGATVAQTPETHRTSAVLDRALLLLDCAIYFHGPA
jgi:hypothetical protein